MEKTLKILNPEIFKTKMVDQLCNQNVINADLKSQDLRKNKKQNNLGIKNPVSKILLFNVLF